MSQLYGIFEKYISSGGKILDLGCGSGRDSKYFIESGYHVTAIDGSAEICRRASNYLGIPVLNMKIEDLSINEKFDGIWACASLLHIKKSNMKKTVGNLLSLLNHKGVLYASWKYGNSEYIENEKYYSDYNEDYIIELFKSNNIGDYKIWINSDFTRKNVRWLNTLVVK
jgi:SAM-dependent methyltransferase